MSELEHARLIWDEDGKPTSTLFEDVYFSRENGLSETRYVFIKHNQLEQRFSAITQADPIFTVGETGFGTGLNFLCALQTFLQHAPSHAQLHFISTEKYPLQKSDLKKALSLWPELAPYASMLVDQYPPLFPGFYNLSFADHRVRLTLLFGDAAEQLSCLTKGPINAWFLDGFAPNKNPELWSEGLLKQVARLSGKSTTFSTFTAASVVNKTLSQLGFRVEKTHGFAHKREMLFGSWQHDTSPSSSKPWFQLTLPTTYPAKNAIIIGGGLAGATSAWSLAKRGWAVTIIEKNNAIAQESSGNLQGVLYARLSAFNNAPNKLMVQAYQHSLNFLNSLYQNQYPDTWSPCGVLQLAFNDKEQKRYDELVSTQLYPADILEPVTSTQASTIAGTRLLKHGIYFPNGGWVNPPIFCHDLINHSNITVKVNAVVNHLAFDKDKNSWVLWDANKNIIAQAPIVIIANNLNVSEFEQTRNLPVKRIRGQITHLKSTASSHTLKTVVCTERYLTPARQNLHSLGATFNLNDDEVAIRIEDHQANLDELAQRFPDVYAALNQDTENHLPHLQGRVGFRAVTPDYMPIIGPVPVESQFIEDYGALRFDSNARISKKGTYYPGLFINTAHGSRGLLTCPLSAELLAGYINNEILPLEKDVTELLHPARFIIKNLIRRKC